MPPHLHKRKGRKIWEIVEGRHRESTGTSRRVLAEKALERYYLTGKGIAVASNESFESYVPAYLAESRSRNKASSVDDKARTLRFFAEHYGKRSVSGITVDDVREYLAGRRAVRSGDPISA